MSVIRLKDEVGTPIEHVIRVDQLAAFSKFEVYTGESLDRFAIEFILTSGQRVIVEFLDQGDRDMSFEAAHDLVS